VNCPLCGLVMNEYNLSNLSTSHMCEDKSCMFHKMPRYKIRLDARTNLRLSEIIIMDPFYVEIDFLQKTTKISKLDVVMLSDTIYIAHALHLDLQNYSAALDKIRLLVTFS
jgi:hypothetical protein